MKYKADRTNTRYANYSGYTPIAPSPKREPIGVGWWLFALMFAAYFLWQFSR